MKRKFILRTICIFALLLMISGCVTIEQQKEKKNIEKEIKQIMIDYLQDNYNINKVNNVDAKYTLEGDLANSEFLGTVTGSFKKDGQSYQILCDYDKKICYDSFSYIEKVNPILTNHIKSILDKYSLNNITKPNYVVVHDMFYGLYRYLDNNSYGFFNNYDKVNTYEDVVNYYNARSIEIIYNSADKIIENNTSVFENLYKEINLFIQVNVYHQGVIKENFTGDAERGFEYYINEIINIGDFTAYWHVEGKNNSSLIKNEQGDFKLTLINNDSDFDKQIELYGSEYKLYNQKILMAQDISDNDNTHRLYLKLNRNVCNSNGIIVYKDNFDGYKTVTTFISYNSGEYETKKFAIYCRN